MLAGVFERVETTEVGLLTRSRLESMLEDVGALESFLASRRLDLMAAIDGLGDGGLSSDSVLRSKAKVSDKQAKKAAGTAATLQHMPKTAQRLRDGEITEAHAAANAAAADRAEDPAAADVALNQGPVVPPADLHAKQTRKWAGKHESREKARRRHERQRRNRKAIFGKAEEDGSWSLYATSDTGEGKDLQGLIEAEADRLFRIEDGGRGGNSDRTRSQRLLDALVNLVKRGAGREATTAGPTDRHPRFQPLLRLTLGDYLDDVEGELVGDGPLPAAVVERVLCESGLDVLITADDGSPLWLGRSRREATPEQWIALIERDEGCVVCGADPSRCEAHHLVWWTRDEGPTDIDNLVLLCSTHHHDLHDRGLVLRKQDGTWLLEPKPVHERQPATSVRGRRSRSRSRSPNQARAA